MIDTRDLERVATAVAKYRAGELHEVRFRAIRVPMGVYEQRSPGTYMVRVRRPGGVLAPAALVRLAALAIRYGNGIVHVTSRQGVQLHGVRLDGIVPVLEDLAAAGLSTRGTGGNTVRSVTVCAGAGVCCDEAFDVSPLAERLTAVLLADSTALNLPRKFKVGIAGCPRDCGGALVNDLGFVARVREGVPGFAVYAGGGMGALSRIADPLKSFMPLEEIDVMAKAVLHVFARHGNRKDKRRARLRFLAADLGPARFCELVRAERSALHMSPGDEDPAGPCVGVADSPPGAPELAGRRIEGSSAGRFALWRDRSVAPQKQPGLFQVTIPLAVGDLPAARGVALAGIAGRFGDGLLRATPEQNLVLRSVRREDLAALHRDLAELGFGEGAPPVIRDLVSCAGASWCKLGLCRSRDLAAALADRLGSSGLDLDSLGPIRIAVGGCPDACGRNPVADIALVGAARRLDGRLVPHYQLALGGRLGEGRTRLATGAWAVPAREVPDLVVGLLAAWRSSSASAAFADFVDAEGASRVEALVGAARAAPARVSAGEALAVDWGGDGPFSLAGRGPGECGAGVMDLIDVDLASAAEALGAGRLLAAAALAARALLVTRGEQPEADREALRMFEREFLATGLVAPAFRPLVESAIEAAATPEGSDPWPATRDGVEAFVSAVCDLYARMDGTLGFGPVDPAAATTAGPPVAAPRPALVGRGDVGRAHGEARPIGLAGPLAVPADVRDFRGVVCPLNYVKTRMALGRLAGGQVLAVLLDEAGARNVPASAAADGQEVLAVMAEGDAFRVLIRKVVHP